MKNVTDRETLEGFLRDLDTRLTRQERHSHHGVGQVTVTATALISHDQNNATRLGFDNGIYTREIVAKATEPTAADFGGRLEIGSIWVKIP